MISFESLMIQIENDKNELFDKIKNLEDENEGFVMEKHGLKIELSKVQAQKGDLESQMKKMKDQLNILETINEFKQDELQELNMEGRSMKSVIEQLKHTQKTLNDMRDQEVVLKNEIEELRNENIQTKSDFEKEQQFTVILKKELSDLRAKYNEMIEGRKNDLGISNLMASKMYTNNYKMRDSTNRQSLMKDNISFYGGEPKDTTKSPTFGDADQLGLNRMSLPGDRNSTFRASQRDSIMMSTLI